MIVSDVCVRCVVVSFAASWLVILSCDGACRLPALWFGYFRDCFVLFACFEVCLLSFKLDWFVEFSVYLVILFTLIGWLDWFLWLVFCLATWFGFLFKLCLVIVCELGSWLVWTSVLYGLQCWAVVLILIWCWFVCIVVLRMRMGCVLWYLILLGLRSMVCFWLYVIYVIGFNSYLFYFKLSVCNLLLEFVFIWLLFTVLFELYRFVLVVVFTLVVWVWGLPVCLFGWFLLLYWFWLFCCP